jgi:hypothetical protein
MSWYMNFPQRITHKMERLMGSNIEMGYNVVEFISNIPVMVVMATLGLFVPVAAVAIPKC